MPVSRVFEAQGRPMTQVELSRPTTERVARTPAFQAAGLNLQAQPVVIGNHVTLGSRLQSLYFVDS